ncbi:Programmed cell death protein 2 [Amphibalanus amphitrite]|uniref:Programmed cell death protein 2 n=1 Tax=Amphibalanus amphitrite TaxID=1232801 RepID=A0A6A4V529_AMPAM|nr:Programmed cell death protein 2 [Amphibalanus amphitrite]
MAAASEDKKASGDHQDIQLGFVERTEPWKLVSRYFPTKVGGRPAWLELRHLPPSEALRCGHCSAPLVFLCQLYAPIEERAGCFHRTVFVFICRRPECSQRPSGGVAALRCQLPLQNPYYPDTPQEERPLLGPDEHSAEHHVTLCAVCGCLGTKNCSICKKVYYCSREHQAIDWKHGHKKKCKEGGGAGSGSQKFLLPESEVVIEDEPADSKKREKTEEERMADYASLIKDKIEALPDADVDELDKMASSSGDDPVFARFRKRVAREPEQVIRYWRGGAPLWVSKDHQPAETDIPDCSCGAKRHFEFQILPQLLNHLDLDEMGDSVDWGTLAVYTCSESCEAADPERPYREEFVWKQQL